MEEEFSPIAVVDIGTSLTKAIIGRKYSEHEVEILGIGTFPSTGLKNGSIVNIETTTKSILESIASAELMAGEEVNSILVNVSGKSIRSVNEKGIISVSHKDRTINEDDLIRVIDQAQSIAVPVDQEILHVLARQFKVDDEDNVKDPIGMTGVRLEALVHIVLCGITSLQNIQRTVESAGFLLSDRVLSSLASSESVLTTSEKDLGIAVVDIGSGICDVIIFQDGGIVHTGVVPFGGFNITSDLSIGLKTTVETAEIVKKRFAHCRINMIDPLEKIDIPSIGGRPPKIVNREDLVAITEPRMREILEMIDMEITRSGVKSSLAGGVLLTGGGSLLAGIEELAEEVLGLSVSKVKPAGVTGLKENATGPEYSCAIGLLKYAIKNQIITDRIAKPEKTGWASKVRRWMEDNL